MGGLRPGNRAGLPGVADPPQMVPIAASSCWNVDITVAALAILVGSFIPSSNRGINSFRASRAFLAFTLSSALFKPAIAAVKES